MVIYQLINLNDKQQQSNFNCFLKKTNMREHFEIIISSFFSFFPSLSFLSLSFLPLPLSLFSSFISSCFPEKKKQTKIAIQKVLSKKRRKNLEQKIVLTLKHLLFVLIKFYLNFFYALNF